MTYDYFYGQQAEMFTFYRVPKVLFTEDCFWNVSTDAKLLYGILLDRMNLSARNGWLDEEGRVYIIFTIEEIKGALGCAEKKAVKLLDEKKREALQLALVGGECYIKPVPVGTGFDFALIPRNNLLVFARNREGMPVDVGTVEKSTQGAFYYTLLERRSVDEQGFLGLFSGGLTAGAIGTSAALILGYFASLVFKPKMKK